jgi:hypothetical protein
MKYIDISITEEMLRYAHEISEDVKLNRTVASPIDTLTGLIGEFAFGQWFLGDWKNHDVLVTKGKADFDDRIEIKTSAFLFSKNLNLLVRKDYAEKRRLDFYVQVMIETPDRQTRTLKPGWNCRISGWATSDDVNAAHFRKFCVKDGGRGGYQYRYIPIRHLNSMNTFPIVRPAPLTKDNQ